MSVNWTVRSIPALLALACAGVSVEAQVTDPPDSILVADSLAPESAAVRERAPTPDSMTVRLARERFGTGRARQLLLGKHYRALWNARVRAEVLDLDQVAGGLTPQREGGGAQTLSLRFRGEDGFTYVFRSLNKEPTRGWPKELRRTLAARLAEDQMSALHPGAALVVAELLEAAGVLHVKPRLVWLPDHPRLGQYRERYGRMLGLFEERPSKEDTRIPGLEGAREIASTPELFEELDKGPQHFVDARQFLAARLVDLFVGDWDRHPDQWVWARFNEGDRRRWAPLPRDRDWALTRLDGVAIAVGRMIEPKHVSFGPEYGSVLGLTLSGQALDRRLLSGLSRPVFDSVGGALQRKLTDSVIEAAVSRLPPEMYSMNGDDLRTALMARRDRLTEVAGEFYDILSGEVNVFGTNDPERVTITRSGPETEVAMHGGDAAEPWFRRRFDSRETKEVRLYLQGGADVVEIGGSGNGAPLIRLVTGQGRDRIVDSSTAGGIRLYDPGDGTEISSLRGITQRRAPYVEYIATDSTLIPPRDWGHWWRYTPWVTSGPDVGFFLGAAATRYTYGFRKQPYASRMAFRGGYAMGATTYRAEFEGEFRRTNSRARTNVLLRASGIEIVRFHGFGNETPLEGTDAFYRVAQEQYLVEPSLSLPIGPAALLTFGPTVKYATTDLDPSRAIAVFRPYGVDGFGQLGGRADLSFDTRDSAATRGVRASVGGAAYPAVWDVADAFGDVHAEVSTFLTARSVPLSPTLALRGGGRKVFGTYPFFEAAFVGGASTVRGLREQRYAGDAAVYGNAELRLALTRVLLFVPTDVGIFGLADAGRVFLEGESSSEVHTGFGGGLSFSFLTPANTVSLALVRGEDRTGFYLRAGFGF